MGRAGKRITGLVPPNFNYNITADFQSDWIKSFTSVPNGITSEAEFTNFIKEISSDNSNVVVADFNISLIGGNQSKITANLTNFKTSLFINTEVLEISSIPVSADTISFNGCTIPQYGTIQPVKLFSLNNCNQNTIGTLPSGLLQLDVANNNLTALPVLPSGLTDLYCYFNMISSIASLPSTLVSLDILGNPINTLPTLPTGLSQLNISSCDFTTAGLDGILDQLTANNQNSQAIGTVIMQTQSTGQSPTTSKVTALEALGWTVIV